PRRSRAPPVMNMTEPRSPHSLDNDVRHVAPAATGLRALAAAPVSRATWFAAGEALASFVVMGLALALVILLVVGVAMVPVFGVGVPIVALALLAARGLARAERARIDAQLGTQIARPAYLA